MNQSIRARDDAERALLDAIKQRLPELKALLHRVSSHDYGEDAFYRFYHQSFKVYWLQEHTREIVTALQSLAPDRPLHEWFLKIVNEGTGREFKPEHNRRWLEETRPMVESFFHARTMLEFAVRYGGELDAPPRRIPSGWAAVLYLYGLR